MAETLATITANVVSQTLRSDLEAEIKAEIKASIREFNRRPWYLTEVRGGTFATVAGTEFYNSVDFTAGASYGDSTDFTATTSAKDVVSIRYAKIEDGSIDIPLDPVPYRDFEALREGSQTSGYPNIITLYAGQIGVWPIPTNALTIYISATVKGAVPSSDTDGSVWFEEAQELIEASAAKRLYAKYIKDTESALVHQEIERGQIRAILAEATRKMGTGRVRPTRF
jgi:hypothetical protein